MLISKPVTVGIMLLLILLLQGCGRKGPLYMPKVPATPAPVAELPAAQSQVIPTPAIQSQPEASKQP